MNRARRRLPRAAPDPPGARRTRCGWPLTLAALALPTVAHAAAFLPGVEADPPTGDVTPQAPAAAPAPPAGNGLRFVFGPWRSGGSLGLDGRWQRVPGGDSTRQLVLTGEVDWANYIWQPWFAQVRFGVGFVASRDGGDGVADGSRTIGGPLNGRFGLSLFPASRFPFELRAEVTDSRVGGDPLVADQRSRRIALAQSYRPEVGADSVALQLEHSRIDTGGFVDSLLVVQANAHRYVGAHAFEFSAHLSENDRSDTEESSRFSSLTASHGYNGVPGLQVDTLATWNDVRLRGGADTVTASSDVRQLSTFATWRPPTVPVDEAGRTPLSTLQLSGSARFVESRSIGADGTDRAQGFNATVGAGIDLSPAWRASGALSVAALRAASLRNETFGVNAGVGWSPEPTPIGEWRYTPGASANASYAKDTENGDRATAGLQFSHGVGRDIRIGEHDAVGLNLAQSLGVLRESESPDLARAIAHSAGASWQSMSEDGSSQRLVGLTLSDSRSFAAGRGTFQLANLQLTQRAQLSRFSSWAANLTVQATRNQSTEVDVFTGERRKQEQGWQTFASGSVSLDQTRVFGVPRLRHSLVVTGSTQQLESRAQGDIDAPLERTTASVESRLDWSIGRLEARLVARAARIEGATVAGVSVRLLRRF